MALWPSLHMLFCLYILSETFGFECFGQILHVLFPTVSYLARKKDCFSRLYVVQLAVGATQLDHTGLDEDLMVWSRKWQVHKIPAVRRAVTRIHTSDLCVWCLVHGLVEGERRSSKQQPWRPLPCPQSVKLAVAQLLWYPGQVISTLPLRVSVSLTIN